MIRKKTSEAHKRRLGILRPENKKVSDLRKGTPPLTSIEQFEKTRKEINALNRQRSSAMERRIAKYLRGRRTPSSGAMAKYKGDVEIPFENFPSGYVIECKLSAQLVKSEPVITFDYGWLPKIEKEAKDMNMRFGILIIHFQGDKDDYVLFSKQTARLLIDKYHTPYSHVIEVALTLPLIDFGAKGKTKKIYKKAFDSALTTINDVQIARIKLTTYEVILVGLEQFRAFVEHM